MSGIPPVPKALQQLGATLLNQGAEGVKFLGRDAVVKERFSKSYRHPILDQRLNAKRLNQEAKSILKARKLGIRTPTILFLDQQNSLIYMELVQGQSVRATLQADASPWTDASRSLAAAIGRVLARMHDGNVIHGDLTTSNIMVDDRFKGDKDVGVVVIDFGLSFSSSLVEDKAVDLYVLERAFISTHIHSEELFKEVMNGYKAQSSAGSEILEKLEEGAAVTSISDT